MKTRTKVKKRIITGLEKSINTESYSDLELWFLSRLFPSLSFCSFCVRRQDKRLMLFQVFWPLVIRLWWGSAVFKHDVIFKNLTWQVIARALISRVYRSHVRKLCLATSASAFSPSLCPPAWRRPKQTTRKLTENILCLCLRSCGEGTSKCQHRWIKGNKQLQCNMIPREQVRHTTILYL